MELLRRGYEVNVVVHEGAVLEQPGVILHRLDLLDVASVEHLMEQHHFTHLLHLAWYVGTKCHIHNLNIDWLAASLQLIRSFARHGGMHVLGAGACTEYEYKYGLLREQETPTNPGTLYGNGKNALYHMARIFCAQNNIQFHWPRIFNLYGPHEKPNRLVPSVILSCLRGEDVRVSECINFLDYTHVADTARGIVDVFESGVSGAVNICSGQPVQLRTIVERIAELTSFKGDILWGAVPSAFDAPFVVGDNTTLRSIGWIPQYHLTDGLQETINYWKQYVS